jgi:molybdopterin/thiamine biosynthesis adenylyltransferase
MSTAHMEPVEVGLGATGVPACPSLRPHIVVVGAGNIGSHVIGHLGRILADGQVTIIDPDIYEERNLTGQEIRRCDIGKPKALVQAQRVRAVNRSLIVRALRMRVQDVPLARLRGDTILACLDSRAARQYVNQCAWRLGVPWIDSGVNAAAMLVRVNVYVPSFDAPCLECGWSDRDYALLAQVLPCMQGRSQAPPTNAPAHLGALAAGFQAIELSKLLRGETDSLLAGRELMVESVHHQLYLSAMRRNPSCRFDHAVWAIQPLGRPAGGLTVSGALAMASPGRRRPSPDAMLHFDGRPIAKGLMCRSCGARREVLRLKDRLRPSELVCTGCGGEMVAVGFDLTTSLSLTDLPASLLQRTLASAGIGKGDVFTLCSHDGSETHHEIQVSRASSCAGTNSPRHTSCTP